MADSLHEQLLNLDRIVSKDQATDNSSQISLPLFLCNKCHQNKDLVFEVYKVNILNSKIEIKKKKIL